MGENIEKAYTEVYTILNFIDEYHVKKISSKFLEYIYNKKDNDYKPEIDMTVPLNKQNLSEDTVNILAMLKYKYWCDGENEKQELLNILNENEQKHQEKLREKYNPDDIFKKSEAIELVPYHKMIIRKIINKIKNIFK